MDTKTITNPTNEQINEVVTRDAILVVLKKNRRAGAYANMRSKSIARRLFPAATPSALRTVERAIDGALWGVKGRPANVRRVRAGIWCYQSDEEIAARKQATEARRAQYKATADAIAAAVANLGLLPRYDGGEHYDANRPGLEGVGVKLSQWGGRVDIVITIGNERSHVGDVHPSKLEAAIPWAIRTHRERMAFCSAE